MPDFLETPRFPSCPKFGAEFGPMYSVTITERASGVERRNRNWSRPLMLANYTVGPASETAAEVQAMLEFFHAVGGPAIGFRAKDYSDFKSCAVHETVTMLDAPLVLVEGVSPANVYQLVKRYTVGAQNQDREIYKPISGTILISDNGALKTETTHYTIDYTTGQVSLLFTPAGTLRWGGEFDIPVRFNMDRFPIEVIENQHQTAQVSLREIRV